MITRLEIQGFKSLVDVSIELGAVNVFIGANGSGKSNLLEAVGILSAIVSGSLDGESIHYRGVRAGRPESFTSSFVNTPNRTISMAASDGVTDYHFKISPDEGHPSKWAIQTESIAFDGVEVLKRTIKGTEILVGSGFDDIAIGNHMQTKSVTPFSRLYFAFNKSRFQQDKSDPNIPFLSFDFFEELKQYAIFTPSTPQLRISEEDNYREPIGRGGEGLGRAILEMLENDRETLGPFDIEDVFELIDWADSFQTDAESESDLNSNTNGGPVKLRIGDRFMGIAHKFVSITEASEGALYVLFMLALVGHQQGPKLFAVDNFDQALHPRLACALTRLIADQILKDDSRQMLATTHNPLVLAGLDMLDDRVRLFTVDRDSEGATRVDRVTVTEELMAQADKGLSLSRLWVMGRLGGVPKYF